MLSGSESPQSSKAPTRGDRLRSDIVQSEMSVPQILHVEWKFKATCTTQAMLLAPWKLLIPCGLLHPELSSRSLKQTVCVFRRIWFHQFSHCFHHVSPKSPGDLARAEPRGEMGLGDEQMSRCCFAKQQIFQRPNAINLHILMIHVFSVLSAVSLCEVTSL